MLGTIKLKTFANFIHKKSSHPAILLDDSPKTPIINDVYKDQIRFENKKIIPKPTDMVNTVLIGLFFTAFINLE